MVDRSLFDVEDFLVDNTFQLYCAGKDQLCITFWENYIKAHPEQSEVIAEAKRLYIILSGNKKPLTHQLERLKENIIAETDNQSIPIRRKYTWVKIAAAVLILLGITFVYRNYLDEPPPKENLITHFTAKDGERKKITLSDGSVVSLNSRSSLTLHEDFNQKNREVNLVGEAFFDVTSNKEKPFIVHTSDFDINVVGTSFNVKVYPGESTAEAILVKGIIVMKSKGTKGNSITLKPNQKVTLYKDKTASAQQLSRKAKEPVRVQEIAINEYNTNDDNSNIEMPWMQNRLEIQDQDFSEVKDVLERWYNVQIKFTNRDIKKYRFTATFNNESINEVLNALQKAEHFKYEINGNKIIISK